MTGVRMEFSFEDEGLRKELKRLAEMDQDFAPFLKSIGEEFTGAGGIINTRFKEEKGPDGAAWAPLASRTIRRRLKKSNGAPITILRMSGELAGSIAYEVTADRLRIGVRSGSKAGVYAAIHQFGGKAGRNRSVPIPARPYLGFSDEDWDMIEEEALDYFMPE